MRYGALSAKMASGVRRLFDSNLKVHFAGSDGQKNFHVALKAAQTNYRLYSCYKYILKKQPDADFRLPENHVIRQEVQGNRHVIFRTAHINYFRKEIFEERLKEVRRIAAEVGVQMSDRSFAHSTNASICATICKKKYERAAGPQN